MIDPTAWSNAYFKVMKFLSLKTIGKTIAVGVLSICLYAMYENRQMLYQGIMSNKNTIRTMIQKPFGVETVANVQTLLDKPTNIVAIQFVSVDFRTNTRSTELFMSNIRPMAKIMEEYQTNKIGATPFFDSDVKNNDRNTALINGEFVCYPFDSIIAFQRFPQLRPYAETLCSVSIPPYPGYFSGYVTFYIKVIPGANEIGELRAAARKLALSSYDLEVTNGQR